MKVNSKRKIISVYVTEPKPIDHKCITWCDMPYTTPEYFVPLKVVKYDDGSVEVSAVRVSAPIGRTLARATPK